MKHAIDLIEPGSFAEACYNQNSVRELEEALTSAPDTVELEIWGLTADEWREQIELALAAKRAE